MAPNKQLSLFDPNCPLPLPEAKSERHTATGTIAPIKISPPPSLPDGAQWREANTPIQAIGFVLMRSKRRSIGLQINDDGLRVTAPKWVSLKQIDAVVADKAQWVVTKIKHYQARRARLALADTQWCHGGTIPYLGQRIVLRLGHSNTTEFFGALFEPEPGDSLQLNLPGDADHRRVRDCVNTWLQARAKEWFDLRIGHFTQAHPDLIINRWRLSNATTRWGACSSDRNVMLNWRLIHFDPAVIDYVIAHELAHLRFMDHSKAFWREVGKLLPDFEDARDILRGHDPASLPLL